MAGHLRSRAFLQSLLLASTLLVVSAGAVAAGTWDPSGFQNKRTLEFLTIGPEEGEHWSTVWFVVIQGKVYIRLGERATRRVRKNSKAPYVSVRIGDEVFERVRLVEAPEMAERVSQAMQEKYLLDVIFRHFSHPLTLRLEPEEEAAPTR